VRKLIVGLLAALPALTGWGRGEPWVVPQKQPPPVATLTNMPRYLEWKWRTDVSDPATGLDNAALKAGVRKIFAELEDREPWCVVRAKMFGYLADNMALGYSRFDCFPAIACWNRYDRPLNDILSERERHVDAKYDPGLRDEIAEGRRANRWSMAKDFDTPRPTGTRSSGLASPA